MTARRRAFPEEGFQEPYIAFVKSLTNKPVVGVGRYTSPDTMARIVGNGILDLIGAARPSIADPFLPNKIRDGRIDDIRECIGCNICVAGDRTRVPIRCTQNPTMGEEWRRGWHPEAIPPLDDKGPYLVVGGGPAGLEAARALAQRGAEVVLADAGPEWGGRVSLESRLPGLAAWARVRDWRLGQLRQSPNVRMYLESRLTAADILEHGSPHVVLATGAAWRADGVGREHRTPLPFLAGKPVLTPDDLMTRGAGAIASPGAVVIFDDDRFYMGSVLAELVAGAGHRTIFVTPAPIVAPWSENTLEQERIQKRLIGLGVEIVPLHGLAGLSEDRLRVECVYSGRTQEVDCGTLVAVTSRLPNDGLWDGSGRPQGRVAGRRRPVGDADRRLPRAGPHRGGLLLRPRIRPVRGRRRLIPENRSRPEIPASPRGIVPVLLSGADARFPGRSRSPHGPVPPCPLPGGRSRTIVGSAEIAFTGQGASLVSVMLDQE